MPPGVLTFLSLSLVGVIGVVLYGVWRTLYEILRTMDGGEDGE